MINVVCIRCCTEHKKEQKEGGKKRGCVLEASLL